jgi:hypothetical protein
MNVGLIQSDHVVTRNDLQLVYSVANKVREHWQVDERKTSRIQGRQSVRRRSTDACCELSGIQ